MALKEVKIEGEKFLYRVRIRSELDIRALVDHLNFFRKLKLNGQDIEVVVHIRPP